MPHKESMIADFTAEVRESRIAGKAMAAVVLGRLADYRKRGVRLVSCEPWIFTMLESSGLVCVVDRPVPFLDIYLVRGGRPDEEAISEGCLAVFRKLA